MLSGKVVENAQSGHHQVSMVPTSIELGTNVETIDAGAAVVQRTFQNDALFEPVDARNFGDGSIIDQSFDDFNSDVGFIPPGVYHQDEDVEAEIQFEMDREHDDDIALALRLENEHENLALEFRSADNAQLDRDITVEQLANEGISAISDFYEQLRSENRVRSVGVDSSESFLLDDTVSDSDL
jgi:hypothetical protein